MRQRIDVIFEDNHLLVVNKPALLPTMGTPQEESSLVDRARQYLKIKYHKPGNVFLGVVSRLDAFVSGLIVLARTSKAASRLSRQFADGEVEKTYWAIVEGDCGEAADLQHWLFKDDKRRRMVALSRDPENQAKRARLRYRRIGRSGPLSLLEIELLTGRKHQIRVQLAAHGCSIVGDRKYGNPTRFSRGIALHSRRLVFQHPTRRELMRFDCDPPRYWNVHRFASGD